MDLRGDCRVVHAPSFTSDLLVAGEGTRQLDRLGEGVLRVVQPHQLLVEVGGGHAHVLVALKVLALQELERGGAPLLAVSDAALVVGVVVVVADQLRLRGERGVRVGSGLILACHLLALDERGLGGVLVLLGQTELVHETGVSDGRVNVRLGLPGPFAVERTDDPPVVETGSRFGAVAARGESNDSRERGDEQEPFHWLLSFGLRGLVGLLVQRRDARVDARLRVGRDLVVVDRHDLLLLRAAEGDREQEGHDEGRGEQDAEAAEIHRGAGEQHDQQGHGERQGGSREGVDLGDQQTADEARGDEPDEPAEAAYQDHAGVDAVVEVEAPPRRVAEAEGQRDREQRCGDSRNGAGGRSRNLGHGCSPMNGACLFRGEAGCTTTPMRGAAEERINQSSSSLQLLTLERHCFLHVFRVLMSMKDIAASAAFRALIV